MEFRNKIDIQIAEKMTRVPLLGEIREDGWNLQLTTEFNMTTSSYLFRTEVGNHRVPLYEGKMIHQFEHHLREPRYWVDEREGRKSLLKGKIDKGQTLDYQLYRLGYRAIARSTDARTMITTILPPNSFFGHSINASHSMPGKILLFITAMLNSLVVDFALRQRVSANLTMFYIYQLPIPRLTEKDPAFAPIVERAAKLICTTPEFDDLAREVGLGSHQNGVTDPAQRAVLRAELDGLIAHVYGLTEVEFSHILSTFPLVTAEIKEATLEVYRKIT